MLNTLRDHVPWMVPLPIFGTSNPTDLNPLHMVVFPLASQVQRSSVMPPS
jgi:hypothetical protein